MCAELAQLLKLTAVEYFGYFCPLSWPVRCWGSHILIHCVPGSLFLHVKFTRARRQIAYVKYEHPIVEKSVIFNNYISVTHNSIVQFY